MGFFDRSKPNVSKREFSQTCSSLYAKGFSKNEVNKVKNILRGDLSESSSTQQGIDQGELQNAVSYMKKSGAFSDNKIKVIEEQLKKRL